MLSGTSRYLSLLHGEKKHCVDSENGTCKPHTTVSYAHPHCPVCSCCCRHTTHSLLVSVSVSRCRPPPVVHVPESAPSLVVSQKYIYSVAPWTFFPRINIYLLLPQTAPHLSSPHFALSSTPTYPSWSSIPLSCPDHSLAPRFPPRLTLAHAHLLVHTAIFVQFDFAFALQPIPPSSQFWRSCQPFLSFKFRNHQFS
jgi:hypothetical protein